MFEPAVVSLDPQAQRKGYYLVVDLQGQEYSIYLDQQRAAEDHPAAVVGNHQDLPRTHMEVGLDDHTVAVRAET